MDEHGVAFNRRNLYNVMSLLRTSAQRGVPDLECDGNTISSDLGKATTFNNFFVEQSRQSLHGCTGPPPPIHTPRVTDRTLQDVTATEVEVLELLRHIDTNKSAGPDGIPSILLKLTADRIAPSLTIIFNHSFTHGQVPRDWRDAMVSPIFKKGRRQRVRIGSTASDWLDIPAGVPAGMYTRWTYQQLATPKPHEAASSPTTPP